MVEGDEGDAEFGGYHSWRVFCFKQGCDHGVICKDFDAQVNMCQSREVISIENENVTYIVDFGSIFGFEGPKSSPKHYTNHI
ncbi:hypothetical protein E2542_SST14217 [Spatholobus suberectus]|nr:hypothetical protein E2542_SST14217 [Spatholobus suberectus]